jgi:hypothetical protein
LAHIPYIVALSFRIRRFNFDNASYHSVQNFLFSRLLSKNLKIRIYKTIILPVVFLYGCETWCLTLREEHRLGVFENRVLRRIFGPKRDDLKGDWRKLHNEELHDLHSSPSIIRIHCRDNRLIHGGKVVLSIGRALLLRNIIFLLLVLISVKN